MTDCSLLETIVTPPTPPIGPARHAPTPRRRRSAGGPVLVLALGLIVAGCGRSGRLALPGAAAETAGQATTTTGQATTTTGPATTTTGPATTTTGPAAPPVPDRAGTTYPLHTVTATVFWVGEPADGDNRFITNADSAWDDQWQEHFGGVDDPDHRAGWRPAGFTPRENPFYVALPYDDLDDDDQVRPSAAGIPWGGERAPEQSVLKNRWVRIERGGRAVYAQWEDVGPFKSDDFGYVFGSAAPANKGNDAAGIDVSPAVGDQLGLDGMDRVSWRFVERADVPAGPWLSVVTTSGVSH